MAAEALEMSEIDALLSIHRGENYEDEYEEELEDSLCCWDRMNEALDKDDRGVDLNIKAKEIAEALDKTRQKAEAERLENERKAKERAVKAELESRKRIRPLPFGLRVFPGKPYGYFTSKDLNLERDFDFYSEKRQYLKTQLGMTDEVITQIFSDPYEFVLHLCPESRSFMILNESDFVSICDYLFYAQVATANQTVMQLYKKALFDLLRNYGYTRWQLKLKHILATMLNLGANPDLIMNKNHFEHSLEERLKLVKQMYRDKEQNFKFNIAKFPEFFENFRSRGSHDVDVDHLELFVDSAKSHSASSRDQAEDLEDARYRSIKHLVKLVKGILTTFPEISASLLAPKSVSNIDWLNSLILIHIVAVCSTDHKLLQDYVTMNDVMMIFNAIFNSFTPGHWTGIKDTENVDDTVMAYCDVTESLFYAGHIFQDAKEDEEYQRLIREQHCWTKEETPTINHLYMMDHHHNAVHRLDLLPPTFRGNQIKKSVAFMHLQQFVDPRSITNFPHANIHDVWTWLESKRPKLKLLFAELYLTLNILRLISMIAGSEPLLDFVAESNRKALTDTYDFLTNCGSQFLRQNPDSHASDVARVTEFISQLGSKWRLMVQEAKDAKYESQMSVKDYVRLQGLNVAPSTDSSDNDD